MGNSWISRRARRASRRALIGTVVVAVALITAGSVLADAVFGGGDNPWPYNTPDRHAEVLATVGDISCQPGTLDPGEKKTDGCSGTNRNAQQNATAEQVEAMHPRLVAILGDEQYQNGYYTDFENSFDKYWGAFKFLERPSPGNHEFYDNHGQSGVRGLGYFAYYNGIKHNADGSEVDTTVNSTPTPVSGQPVPQQSGQAGQFGTTGDGWYSYNMGNWHLISLNVECADEPGKCSNAPGTWFNGETTWLAHDLATDHKQCTLAYWHQPTFSSTEGSSPSQEGQTADAWWKLLYAHHADVVLNGHDHVYSRFAPMDPAGNADPRKGIREFVVGTGGEALDTVIPSTPNLQAWSDEYYGVMKMVLKTNGYSWDYESAMRDGGAPAGTPASYSDSGSGTCHGSSDS